MSFRFFVLKKLLSCLLVSSLVLGSCYAQGDDFPSNVVIKKSFFSVLAAAGVGGFITGLTNGDKHWGSPAVIIGAMVTGIALLNLFGPEGGEGQDHVCGSNCPCNNSTFCHSAFCGCDSCASSLDDRFWPSSSGCNCSHCEENHDLHPANQGLRDSWDNPELY